MRVPQPTHYENDIDAITRIVTGLLRLFFKHITCLHTLIIKLFVRPQNSKLQ